MKRLSVVLLVLSAGAAPVRAQAPIPPGSRFAWDQTAPTLAAAQGYTYKLYTDGLSGAVPLQSVVCAAGATPGVFACDGLVPAQTAGVPHTAQITAQGSTGAESGPSNTYAYVFTMTTAAPVNLRKK